MALRAIIYDTETTGTNPYGDRIIELAAYDVERKTSFETLINPKMPIPPESTQISKITDAMVKDARCFDEVIDEFCSFCEGEVMLVAHNNDAFDLLFLQQEFGRNKRTLPDHWLFFDTLKWARRYRNDLPRHSLQFLRQSYNIPPNQAHRALNDVMVLYEVYKHLVDDLTCEQMLDLLSKRTQKKETNKAASFAAMPSESKPQASLFDFAKA